jgi:hypothetical protein
MNRSLRDGENMVGGGGVREPQREYLLLRARFKIVAAKLHVKKNTAH